MFSLLTSLNLGGYTALFIDDTLLLPDKSHITLELAYLKWHKEMPHCPFYASVN